jgi:hypothetical protein
MVLLPGTEKSASSIGCFLNDSKKNRIGAMPATSEPRKE